MPGAQVYFFTSSEGHTLYMGKDKFENEELIKYGLPEDVWFHVDDLSSAHVYLRQGKGEKLDDMSETTIQECCHLVKANSIAGSKSKSVAVVYTKWRNLRKSANMVEGQVGFNNQANVRRVEHVEKDNAIVNALNKTKREEQPDLVRTKSHGSARLPSNLSVCVLQAGLQEKRAQEFRAEQKAIAQAQKEQEKKERKEKEEAAKERSYDRLFENADMQSNSAAVDEDDFM